MNIKIKAVLAGLVIVLAFTALKLTYFGWEYQNFGRVGEYEVKAYQTVHKLHPYAIFVNDAAGGYYRVFDRNGRKVFEIFSDEFAFDIVIAGETRVEIQFARGDTLIWKPDHFE